jgi:hypothetical protein
MEDTSYMIRRWALQNAAGEHDDDCEQRPGFYICHCSKRRREAEGNAEPPENLFFSQPECPRCYQSVFHNGDCWECKYCSVTWSNTGTDPEFTDDHGDLQKSIKNWTRVSRLFGRRFDFPR